MNKILILTAAALVLTACNTDKPKPDSEKPGKPIGTPVSKKLELKEGTITNIESFATLKGKKISHTTQTGSDTFADIGEITADGKVKLNLDITNWSAATKDKRMTTLDKVFGIADSKDGTPACTFVQSEGSKLPVAADGTYVELKQFDVVDGGKTYKLIAKASKEAANKATEWTEHTFWFVNATKDVVIKGNFNCPRDEKQITVPVDLTLKPGWNVVQRDYTIEAGKTTKEAVKISKSDTDQWLVEEVNK